MKGILVKFNTAKLAQQKGFTAWQEYHYNVDGFLYCAEDLDGRGYPAPTLSELQRLLRERKIHIAINRDEDMWKYELYTFKDGNKHIPRGFKNYVTYEQALEEGLQEALRLIK